MQKTKNVKFHFFNLQVWKQILLFNEDLKKSETLKEAEKGMRYETFYDLQISLDDFLNLQLLYILDGLFWS